MAILGEPRLDDFRNKYKTKFQDFFNNESKSNESKSNESKLDSKSSDSVDAIKEYPLEFYEIFCKYQSLLESLLEEYARRNNMKQDAIFFECRDALDGHLAVLFEEPEYQWFVEEMLSWFEYEEFIKKMQEGDVPKEKET